jgi:hypothetical protein
VVAVLDELVRLRECLVCHLKSFRILLKTREAPVLVHIEVLVSFGLPFNFVDDRWSVVVVGDH